MRTELSIEQKQKAKMMIRFYNMQAGTAFRNSDWRMELVSAGIEKCNGVLAEYKDYIRKFVAKDAEAAKKSSWTQEILDMIELDKAKEAQEQAQPTVEAGAPEAVPMAMDILSQAITNILAQTQVPKIEAEIMGSVQQSVRDFIKSEYGTIERKIVTVIDGKHVPMQGVQHEKFERVVKYVANNKPVFLTGPAGSGKNVLCKQVAEALGLKFYFTNAVTQEYKLTGFTDAMGNYQETQFYKAFTEGGLFMLDEMDASIPEVLVILNAAIANRYFDFPAPIGYREAHPDFRVIAAGNTYGQGASYEYVGRNQLDAASLNRFATIKIDYSEEIENNVAGGDIELADFCRAFRKAALDAGQHVVVSYRNIDMVATMSKIMELDEVIEDCLVKGMEKDDLNVIIGNIPDSKYKTALRKVIDRL